MACVDISSSVTAGWPPGASDFDFLEGSSAKPPSRPCPRRRREIGVRMVFGAQAETVVGDVLVGTLRTAGLGLVVGGITAALAMRLLQGLLFGLSPVDPPTCLGAATVLLGTSALAAWVPARRSALAHPMRALGTSRAPLLEPQLLPVKAMHGMLAG